MSKEKYMLGQRLRLARKRAGFSMRKLADAITPNVSAQAISKYESGQMLPSYAVLIGLVKTLDVSLDFLMSSQVEKLDGLEFRKTSQASARDRAKAEAILIDRLERYLAIEQILEMPADLGWAETKRYDSVACDVQIDERADQLRESWNLGMNPIPSLCDLIEDKGVKVIEVDLPDTISGLSCRALRSGEVVAEAIVVSNQINVERKRFTLAHEIAHRIIRSTGNKAIDLESAMDRFAGSFLLPSQSIRDELGSVRKRIKYYEIVRLKHKYGISAAAVLTRMNQVGVLTHTDVARAFATFASSWRKLEPDPICDNHSFATSEKSCRFERLVLRAVGEELISPVRAAKLLDWSLDSVEQKISGPKIK